MSELDYDKLAKEYGNFMTPAMAVTIDGKIIKSDSAMKISQMDVDLSLDSVCSARFTLEGVYDREKSAFFSEVKNGLQLGSIITVQLGYGSATKKIFEGYIHEMTYSYSSVPSITATALDVQKLMMMNRENRTFNEKTYTEIFNDVMKPYKKVCSRKEVHAFQEKIPRVVQNASDYDFVTKELCQKANVEFYVLAGVAYFQEKNTKKTSLLTLTWGENLMSFQVSRSFLNEEISIYGIDEKTMISSKETVKTEGRSKAVTTSALKNEVVNANIKDQKMASSLAKKEAEIKRRKSKSGAGSCIGIPELVPGRYLTIEKLDVDGSSEFKGYLTKVSHSFGDDGFMTEFEMGG